MDHSFLSFIMINSHLQPVPYPWERCYDFRTESLTYKNRLNGVVVRDLRPRVGLGAGFFLESSSWNDRMSLLSLIFRQNRYHQDRPFVLDATCCRSEYVIVPEPVQRCPFCFRPIIMTHA